MKKIPLKGGGEVDALSGWKKYLKWRAGQRKYWKRKYNKRFRKLGKELKKVDLDE